MLMVRTSARRVSSRTVLEQRSSSSSPLCSAPAQRRLTGPPGAQLQQIISEVVHIAVKVGGSVAWCDGVTKGSVSEAVARTENGDGHQRQERGEPPSMQSNPAS